MFLFLILVSTLLSLLAFYNFYWKRRKLPPGPTPLPFIGNARSMAKAENIFDLFHQWTKTYGPVHTFWMGEDPIVAVADYKLIEETFLKDGDAYAGRPMTANFPAFLRRGFRGIIVTQESLWREQRRFALHALREFGFGKNIMQEKILEETADLIANIKNDIKCGIKEHTITKYIDPAIGSIINALLFGYRFEGGKLPEFYKLKKLLGEIVKTSRSPFTFAMQRKTEWLRYIPVFSSFYYKTNQNIDRVFGFLERQVNEHLNEIDYNSEPTDFVDAYLRKKAKLDEEGGPHYYSMEQLLATIFDLWLAGQETTSTTLAYSIAFLILNQDAQQKLQAELDKVVGSSRLVTLEDRPKLNYTIAVVNETQRLTNIIAINVRHTTLKDVEILGYKLPKGTTIVPQISVVMSDPKIFLEPEKFKPERFLDETGQLKKVDELIPFSIGRRQCLGESLAKMELFLLIANIFNQFKITTTSGKPPEVVRKLANTLAPPTFTCAIETRF